MSLFQSDHSLYSSRAKNMLLSPKFALSSSRSNDFSWRSEYVSGEHAQIQTDKILTLQYSNPTNVDVQNIILEAICYLSQGKELGFLFALSFRELENFLRDENHVMSFTDNVINTAEATFSVTKSSLLTHLLLPKMRLPAEWSAQKKSWIGLTLLEKNRALMTLFSELSKLFPAGKGLELVLAEGTVVTVKKNDFPLDLSFVEGLVGHFFSDPTGNSPLKVVGTL